MNRVYSEWFGGAEKELFYRVSMAWELLNKELRVLLKDCDSSQ